MNSNRRYWIKLAAAFLFLATAIGFSLVEFVPAKYDLQVGVIAPENIIAPRRIVDVTMTGYLQEKAANEAAPVYDYMNSAGTRAEQQTVDFFAAMDAVYMDYLGDGAVENLNQLYVIDLSNDDLTYYLQMPTQSREVLKNSVLAALSRAYAKEIKASELEKRKDDIIASLDESVLTSESLSIASKAIKAFVMPNVTLNEELTERARQQARDGVYEVVYEAGQTIINKGTIVTQNQLKLLEDNGLIRRPGLITDPLSDVAVILLLASIIGLFLFAAARSFPEVYGSTKSFCLLICHCILMLALAKIASYFSMYLIPIAFFSMAACILYPAALALLSSVYLNLVLAIMLQLDVDSFIYLMLSSFVAIFMLRRIKGRNSILLSGLAVIASNVLSVMLFSAFRAPSLKELLNSQLPINLGYAMGSGVFSIILTVAVSMLWESFLNIATPFKLLEMAAPGDPLIQRLMIAAPGTYHHSLIVSNLAEAACEEIGANALLARVGSYYHDVGKLNNTEFFRENQGAVNPHDSIAPETSAQIIKAHVSSGLELAKAHHLPKEISAFIRTHHGTSEITFFKIQAEKAHYTGPETFHYNYELPRSKETSIVMLADSSEAAVRSMESHAKEDIRIMIDRVVSKKLKEGQLKESLLSFDELNRVKASFLSVLLGVYHERVQYPESAPQNASEADEEVGEA